MFLLKFKVKNEGKEMLLHHQGVFVGGDTYRQAEQACYDHSAKAVSVGGFDIIEVSMEELAEMIGTTVENPSFKILAVHGGLIPFDGVEIIKKGS